eukprot:SAG31_NODE_21979_length_536_cov_1.183066_1_plen_53_part_10
MVRNRLMQQIPATDAFSVCCYAGVELRLPLDRFLGQTTADVTCPRARWEAVLG